MNRRIEPTFGPGDGPPPLPPAPRPSGAPPSRGMHGCLIALIVCAALALPLGGILAAIAIPAYQDYVVRAKVAQALALGTSLKSGVEDGFGRAGRCPPPAEPALDARRPAAAAIASAVTGEFAPGRCGVRLVLRGHAKLEGKVVEWERVSGSGAATWQCSTDLDARWVRSACRTR